jgi:hypothetical protein
VNRSFLTVLFALRLLIIVVVCAFSVVPSFLLRCISLTNWVLILVSIAVVYAVAELYVRYSRKTGSSQ